MQERGREAQRYSEWLQAERVWGNRLPTQAESDEHTRNIRLIQESMVHHSQMPDGVKTVEVDLEEPVKSNEIGLILKGTGLVGEEPRLTWLGIHDLEDDSKKRPLAIIMPQVMFEGATEQNELKIKLKLLVQEHMVFHLSEFSKVAEGTDNGRNLKPGDVKGKKAVREQTERDALHEKLWIDFYESDKPQLNLSPMMNGVRESRLAIFHRAIQKVRKNPQANAQIRAPEIKESGGSGWQNLVSRPYFVMGAIIEGKREIGEANRVNERPLVTVDNVAANLALAVAQAFRERGRMQEASQFLYKIDELVRDQLGHLDKDQSTQEEFIAWKAIREGHFEITHRMDKMVTKQAVASYRLDGKATRPWLKGLQPIALQAAASVWEVIAGEYQRKLAKGRERDVEMALEDDNEPQPNRNKDVLAVLERINHSTKREGDYLSEEQILTAEEGGRKLFRQFQEGCTRSKLNILEKYRPQYDTVTNRETEVSVFTMLSGAGVSEKAQVTSQNHQTEQKRDQFVKGMRGKNSFAGGRAQQKVKEFLKVAASLGEGGTAMSNDEAEKHFPMIVWDPPGQIQKVLEHNSNCVSLPQVIFHVLIKEKDHPAFLNGSGTGMHLLEWVASLFQIIGVLKMSEDPNIEERVQIKNEIRDKLVGLCHDAGVVNVARGAELVGARDVNSRRTLVLETNKAPNAEGTVAQMTAFEQLITRMMYIAGGSDYYGQEVESDCGRQVDFDMTKRRDEAAPKGKPPSKFMTRVLNDILRPPHEWRNEAAQAEATEGHAAAQKVREEGFGPMVLRRRLVKELELLSHTNVQDISNESLLQVSTETRNAMLDDSRRSIMEKLKTKSRRSDKEARLDEKTFAKLETYQKFKVKNKVGYGLMHAVYMTQAWNAEEGKYDRYIGNRGLKLNPLNSTDYAWCKIMDDHQAIVLDRKKQAKAYQIARNQNLDERYTHIEAHPNDIKRWEAEVKRAEEEMKGKERFWSAITEWEKTMNHRTLLPHDPIADRISAGTNVIDTTKTRSLEDAEAGATGGLRNVADLYNEQRIQKGNKGKGDKGKGKKNEPYGAQLRPKQGTKGRPDPYQQWGTNANHSDRWKQGDAWQHNQQGSWGNGQQGTAGNPWDTGGTPKGQKGDLRGAPKGVKGDKGKGKGSKKGLEKGAQSATGAADAYLGASITESEKQEILAGTFVKVRPEFRYVDRAGNAVDPATATQKTFQDHNYCPSCGGCNKQYRAGTATEVTIGCGNRAAMTKDMASWKEVAEKCQCPHVRKQIKISVQRGRLKEDAKPQKDFAEPYWKYRPGNRTWDRHKIPLLKRIQSGQQDMERE